MTQEQLQELKKMPKLDVVSKYFPLLFSGKITKEQYDWILKQIDDTPVQQAREEEGISQVPTSSGIEHTSFTNHTDAGAGSSQKERLLDLLKDGQPHDTREIMEKVYKIEDEKAGNCRIPSRISELRKDGYNIPDAHHVKGGVWGYRLIL